MLRNNTLTYVTLFSSAGIGCYGFKKQGFKCVATNELRSERLEIQKKNKICDLESGYVLGDISNLDVKSKIYSEIDKWKTRGNDKVDVLFATPPCQGISVINHKKNEHDIKRNSLVVDSIEIVKTIQPRVFIFENVMAFQKTLCTTNEGKNIPIGQYINKALGDDYVITGRILNLMNYGSNSSRTRTLVIGVHKSYRNSVTPYDLFPEFQTEKNLREVIFDFSPLEWGEISSNDFYHAFRTYDIRMRSWISGLKAGESAFDNKEIENRPHKVIDGKIIQNVKKTRDKYTRQHWDKFIHCIHTRNDQLAAQNTIHPVEDRVYSIRELMEMMTIPNCFKWFDADLSELNILSLNDKKLLYKKSELNIRRCIGEAVPTEVIRNIAKKIERFLLQKNLSPAEVNKVIYDYKLSQRNELKSFLISNPLNLDVSILMRITELCNAKREENAAFYTNKFIVNQIICGLPTFSKEKIRILEPSVGAGSFVPFLIKRYENVAHVTIDLVDIDYDSVETLKIILTKITIPKNFEINIICGDFLLIDIGHYYDLIVGNPPFSKVISSAGEKEKYTEQFDNKETNNLSVMFLEKCMKHASSVCLVLNKTVLSNGEFKKTRDILKKVNIEQIIDFGRYGFTGVSIETIALFINPTKAPKDTHIYNMKLNTHYIQKQEYITDSKLPSFIIYRDNEFDKVANKMEFGIFDVFRDRQITKSLTQAEPFSDSIWVIKAKNIVDTGGKAEKIESYDQYIPLKVAKGLAAFKYVNNNSVYLTPNMTYNPRVMENIENAIPDGSTAVLIPKSSFKLSQRQISYFSTDEYRTFYRIARNLSTQSINVDKTSVFFYGRLKDDAEFTC
jgi:DNA (cytosine-5)-methyltransferase 1